ncbi:MAG: sugar ABC transporter permease [Chloroflexi bacterium]|nr:sugar ABC transporter permease [Chloroflexota bacterium]
MAEDHLANRMHRRGSLARREEIAFYLFASPWLIGFILWIAGPMLISLGLSFTDYAVITAPHFTGLDNYVQMLTDDDLVWQSLRVTVTYAAGAIPLGLVAALLLALLMNQKIRGIAVFRTIYYMPAVISGVPVALLWMWILNPDFGIVNNALASLGIQGPKWLFSETWVIPSFIIMSLWTIGAPMVIYLAGLQGIPKHLYEAAEIDGAGAWTKFTHITIPMISPIIFFNAVMGVIGSFQIFTPAYVMTNGGPANASLFFGLYLYNNAFKYFKMGYASALAWLMFAIILVLTLLVIRSSPYWVYYESKGEGVI